MIQCNQISKSYGEEPLFEGVTLAMVPGEKLGLVGRNGHGKSTLARIIIGEEEADAGTVSIPPDYRIGFLEQHASYDHASALEVVCDALEEQEGGWKEIHRAEATLSGLGVAESLWHMPPHELSSGYQLRLRLARVLVGSYHMLVLDEPTNYLDVLSIRWLKQFLQRFNGELLLITHDRLFMDDVSTHIAGIHRGGIKKIQGNTRDYYHYRNEEDELYERERQNQIKRRQSVERFVERFRAKDSKASQVQSRIKQLEKETVGDALQSIKSLQFKFAEEPFPGRWIVHTEDLAFRYDDTAPLLFEKLTLSIKPGERIGIVGANGKGKSTLLSLLNGDLSPVNGRVVRSDNTAFACFHAKSLQEIKGSHTIEEEVSRQLPDASRTQVRTICGTMLFDGDNALKSLNVLSGGERARVLLARIIATPSNCLLLDEPTHHLDIESCDALISALKAYQGSIVLITHDEHLIRTIADRLIVFKNDTAFLFEGNYDAFLEKHGWDDGSPSEAAPDVVIHSQKEIRQRRAEVVQHYNDLLRPLRKKREVVEQSIILSEEQQSTLSEKMIACAEEGKGSAIEALSQEHHELDEKLTQLYDEYEQLDQSISTLEKEYEQKKSQFS